MKQESYYAYSYNEENFHGEFTSREQAAAEGFADDEDANIVWTGKAISPIRTPSADRLIEQIAEDATDGDDYGMFDEYLQHIPKEAKDELQSELQALWDRWEKKHKLEPDWFTVTKIKEHTRP